MKTNVRCNFILPVLMIFDLARIGYAQAAKEPEVERTLNNIKSDKGFFISSFYNQDKAFPKPGKELFRQRVTVKDTATRKIKLPVNGWYGIAMFRNEAGTGKIRQDKIGIPLEPYAFSNNIHPKIEAPSFTSCKFYAGEYEVIKLVISLMQPKFSQKR